MKDLFEYIEKIKSYDLEELLNELVKQSKESERVTGHNYKDELKTIAEEKILLIKLEIFKMVN